jgi:predicted adenine nucleotide alpha hydrolase (AANH) superfamily ATPase
MQTILVHSCCAPDALYCLKFVQDEGIYKPEAFFYNPNIYPDEEYFKRFDDMRKVAEHLGVPLHDEGYHYDDFLNFIKGYEDEPEGGQRCAMCIDLRLRRAALYAKNHEFDAFTTVLSVSPHKSADLIKYFGRKNADEVGIEFIFYDFKKGGGFQKSVEMSKGLNLYRQKYCGCAFSM